MNLTLSRCHKGLLLAIATILCLACPARQSAAAVVSATVFVRLTPSFLDVGGILFTLLNDPGADVAQALVTSINEAAISPAFPNRDSVNNKTTIGWVDTTGINTGPNPLFRFNFPITNGAYPRFTIDPLSATPLLVNSSASTIPATTANFVASTAYLTDLGVTQYFLNSTHAGIGGGTVTSNLPGIACTGSCSAIFNEATTVTLFPTLRSDSYFAGWSGGGCSGVGNCQVTMNDETTVTATFDIHPPANLGAAYYPLIGDALAAVVGTSAIINLRAVDLPESPVFTSPVNSPIDVTLNGGLDGTFSSAIGYTSVQGMTVSTGTVTVDKIIIM